MMKLAVQAVRERERFLPVTSGCGKKFINHGKKDVNPEAYLEMADAESRHWWFHG
jgi:hypothetical protein